MADTQPRWLPDGGIEACGKAWRFDPSFRPSIIYGDGSEAFFDTAREIHSAPFENGLGGGFRTTFQGFDGRGDLEFEIDALAYPAGGRIDLTFVMLRDGRGTVREVRWPAPLVADGAGAYAVLNTMQGQLLPSDWPQRVGDQLPFDGQMCSEAAYMPWWGEITPAGGYLAYVRAPWDTKYAICHPEGGPTRIYARHLPSLGKMRYARTVSFYFLPAGCDYVALCRLYRAIADEEGKPVTLREKAAANPNVDRLIGACVMHVPGKKHVVPESRYYDREHPENNDNVTPFSHWEARVRQLKALGVDQLYLHQDGWGQPGYDNQHPDYLPPCWEMGGWEGMKSLSDTMRALGFMFGVHDQYRDYYLDAPTYTPDHAAQSADGSIYGHAIWAGGRQNYLCASLAPAYVKRNFDQLFAHGIHLEGTYLDVFTCNEADECANPRHPMTRAECLRFRAQCFHYLTAHQVVPSSEEVNDWAVGDQVFCHWAPYWAGAAIPVPLFNLVYHDCVIIPWMMPAGGWGIPSGTTGFLQCLLNGGMGYMSETAEGEELAENIRQWQVIRGLQRRVAREKMVLHEFLNKERTRQRTVFADGTSVTVDFALNTYLIESPEDRV